MTIFLAVIFVFWACGMFPTPVSRIEHIKIEPKVLTPEEAEDRRLHISLWDY